MAGIVFGLTGFSCVWTTSEQARERKQQKITEATHQESSWALILADVR